MEGERERIVFQLLLDEPFGDWQLPTDRRQDRLALRIELEEGDVPLGPGAIMAEGDQRMDIA